jgi:hypothetical protein
LFLRAFLFFWHGKEKETVKIIADGKLIRENVPNTRQALLIASNDGRCLAAASLQIVPDTAPTTGKRKNDTEK